MRTAYELKLALALLVINFGTAQSGKRIIATSRLLLCWRKAPAGTFVDYLWSEVSSLSSKEAFRELIAQSARFVMLSSAQEVEGMMNTPHNKRGVSPNLARSSAFRNLAFQSVLLPPDVVRRHGVVDSSFEEPSSRLGQPDYLMGWSREPISADRMASRVPEHVIENFTRHVIHFGTDRLSEPGRGSTRFTDFRGDDKVTYGHAQVSVPHIHKEGYIERPPAAWMIWRDHSQRLNKHIVIHKITELDLPAWLESASLPASDGLLFIHGFNVTFDEAIWRAAQICHDLKFTGIKLCYSWASCGKVVSYMSDEATVDWSATHLKEFLKQVTRNLGLTRLHIIAHSMGNRALLSVLENWKNLPGATPISQVVLAAPDIDAGRFKQIGRVFSDYAQVTLYSSQNDRAIRLSRNLRSLERAGDSSPPIVMNHLSTVDVTAVGREMFGLGHSYFATTSKVFRDLYYIIQDGLTPDSRAGIKKTKQGHWELT
jgi:esterase/lipase superfamily enzyme